VVYMLPAGLFAHRQTSLTLAGNRHWCTGNRPGVACDAARLELMKLPQHRRRMAGGLLQPGSGRRLRIQSARRAVAYFLPRGRNGFSGRLIAPAQARVTVLPLSLQVCVPLSLALRRTKLPLYVASYCRLPLFQLP
jgi:hypothetical protein